MKSLEEIPAGQIIAELVKRLGPYEVCRQLGVSNPGELLTLAVKLDRRTL
jgi:hypothetical protein